MRTTADPFLVFTSYSQNLEDIRLWRALRHVTPGRYIDIGAWDPRIDSMSLGFYEKGWRGYHFEPNPTFAARLRVHRPDETVYEVALSDQQGTMDFYLVGNDGTSSGEQELALAAAGPTRRPRHITVPVTTLAEQFAHQAGETFHWMKIDVEGMEARVLQGWDSDQLRPWIVVVEATRPLSRIRTDASFSWIFEKADYIPACFDGLNQYYVAREHRELAEVVSEPPNVLDLAEDCRLSEISGFIAGQTTQLNKIQNSITWRLVRPIWSIELFLRKMLKSR